MFRNSCRHLGLKRGSCYLFCTQTNILVTRPHTLKESVRTQSHTRVSRSRVLASCIARLLFNAGKEGRKEGIRKCGGLWAFSWILNQGF